MQPPKTIGIIINPKAGKGFPDNAIIARLAASRFKGAAIFTGPGETGAAAFNDDPRLVICDCGRQPGRRLPSPGAVGRSYYLKYARVWPGHFQG
jgi:hypothetical protein